MYPTRTGWVPPSGVLSSAKAATQEKGQAMAAEVSALIAKAVQKEFA
jgi:creatinine amidohydrolase